jgi:uncharacterized damage-inducible protein DinB
MLKKLILVAMFCCAFSSIASPQVSTVARPSAAPQIAASPNAFLKDFQTHWDIAKALALAVAEAMPAGDYSFKPTPEEMSFGQQIAHIAQANYGYCAFAADVKSPYTEPATDAKIDKTVVVQQLGDSFDYCTGIFSKLADAQLDQVHGEENHKFPARDVILGVMIHMVHHRGQAEVYLRLKGIVPPKYKW